MTEQYSPRILITGASGMLGSTLAPYLEQKHFKVFRQGYRQKTELTCDLTCRKETQKLIQGLIPDIIINLVALSDVDRCEADIETAFKHNVMTIENITQALHQIHNPLLIHISTDQVYDGDYLCKEDDIKIINTYAMTKYAGELAAAQTRNSVILRTNFFGPSQLTKRTSFSDWAISALTRKKAITAFTDIHFNPVSMLTLSRIIKKVIQNPVPGIFNLGSHGPMSKAGFILELARVMNLDTSGVTPAESKTIKMTAPRPKNMSMDCSRFESVYDMTLPSLKNEIKDLKKGYAHVL